MALKVLMLRKKLEEKQGALAELRKAAEGFKTREAELETDIDAATTEEEKAVVEAAVDQFDKEKDENTAAAGTLAGEIADIEREIGDSERSKPAPATPKTENRGSDFMAINRRLKNGQTMEQRSIYLERGEVKDFYERMRGMVGEKRAVSGSDLLIPDVVLDLLRDNLEQYSKLIKYVRLRQVRGKSRQTIAGDIPEGVWTEMIGKINELAIDFAAMEVDGYKVGGFIPVHNSILEDAALVNLAGEVEMMLGAAIGFALDKAILYGTGVKMPLGFVTRLAQTKPPDADDTKWVDLHLTNLHKINSATTSGVKLFQAILKAYASAKSRHSVSGAVLCMNETTWNSIVLPESLTMNAAGSLVAAGSGTFPGIGAKVEFLDFIPDGDIVGGYLEKYLLAERQGGSMGMSEHVRFLDDQTVFKATARYDGTPVRPDSFIGINLKNVDVTTAVTFAGDTANAPAVPETPDA